MNNNKNHLDATGLLCPLPVLKLQRLVKNANINDILTMETTDPSSYDDVNHFCNNNNHKLLEFYKNDNILYFKIKKGNPC